MKATKWTTLSELGAREPLTGLVELYRRGSEVVRASELSVGETIVIDGWPILIISEPEAETHKSETEAVNFLASRHGWEGWDTGGGCTALSKTLGEDSYALITETDNPTAPDSLTERVDLYFYFPEDDVDDRDFVELGYRIPLLEALTYDFTEQVEEAKNNRPCDPGTTRDDEPPKKTRRTI